MILGYSVYEILWLLLIYGFLGWCVEVSYAALEKGCFVNRGFLNGPICPIYGFGAVIVILVLTPLKNNIALLFIGSVVITSLLELVTGFTLDRLFHMRWWDYSDVPFNIGGYICLKFSVMWGFVCIALMKGIQPAIYGIVKIIPFFPGVILLTFLLALFAADAVITVITINKLIKNMRLMDELAKKIHDISDEVGEHIYEGVNAAVKKSTEISEDIKEKYGDELDELKEKTDELKEKRDELIMKHTENINELKERYSRLLTPKLLQRRIIKAFPHMKPHKGGEHLAKIRERLTKKK